MRYTTAEETVQAFITSKRDEIAELCQRYHVQRLAIFGSAARDDFNPSCSDVDVLVTFDRPAFSSYLDHYYGLRDGLESLFGRSVDLVREGVITNPFRVQAIENDQREVYAA